MESVSILRNILKLQYHINDMIDKDWLSNNHDFDSAILCESAELIESLAYKWWKKGEVDEFNSKLEIIDILHFIISKVITIDYSVKTELIDHSSYNFDPDQLATWGMLWLTMSESGSTFNRDELISSTKKLVKNTIGSSNLPVILKSVDVLLSHSGMTYEEIYQLYLMKNTLNKFRVSHGYGDGTYVKNWMYEGKLCEDNYVAYQLTKSLSLEGLSVNESMNSIYNSLSNYYANIK